MKKYKVLFEFFSPMGEWKDSFQDNNGRGFTYEEAESMVRQLKEDHVCVKRNIRIEMQ